MCFDLNRPVWLGRADGEKRPCSSLEVIVMKLMPQVTLQGLFCSSRWAAELSG